VGSKTGNDKPVEIRNNTLGQHNNNQRIPHFSKIRKKTTSDKQTYRHFCGKNMCELTALKEKKTLSRLILLNIENKKLLWWKRKPSPFLKDTIVA
jgi:hypothetical protein